MLFLLIASALATLPVWLPSYPPMTDLPQHAAQVTLLRSLQEPGFQFAHLFEINWFTPYLVGYLPIYVLAPAVGIVAACKTVVALSLAALPLSTALLMRETGADPYWAFLSIPAMYGFSYYWGFLNFLVAVPIGMVVLWLAIRGLRTKGTANAWWLALLLNVLFFCHALICGFFALVSVTYILFEAKIRRVALRALLPFVSVVPLALTWINKTSSHPAVHRSIRWDLGWERFSGFVPRLLGVEPHPNYLLVAAALFAIPILAGARLNRRVSVWMPLVVCTLVILFVPDNIYGTDFVFQRFTLFMLPFFLIGLSPRLPDCAVSRVQRLYHLLAMTLVAVLTLATCFRTLAYDRAASGFDGALRLMEPNQRVLSMAIDRDTNFTISPPFLQFAAWYSATKGGLVEPSSAFWHVELVRYKPDSVPKVRERDFEWHPREFSWSKYDGQNYRYFLVSNLSDEGNALFRDSTCPVRLIYSSNRWWLYEQDRKCYEQALRENDSSRSAQSGQTPIL